MSGKRSGVGGRFKATPPDDNPKVAAIVGEKDEEEIESENDIVVSESETSDRVLRKVVVTDTTAKTDGVNDRNPTTSTTTSTSGPKTRATRLRDDAAIVAAAAVVTTKRNRKQQRDLDLKNSSDEENDVTNIDETPPADDDDDDSETDDADETCFKIDKVYSVSDEHNDLEMTVTTEGQSGKQKVGGEDLKDDRKGRGGGVGGSGGVTTPTAVISGVKLVDAAKLKEEKQIKPRIQATATLAKLPAGLGGGVGSVRMLGAGVRGTNMPFIVSMGAGNPGIPLLPAGLPPGRYVILPGSSTTTSKTATVTTMAASGLTTRLATTATGHPTIVTAQKAISAASTTSGTATATPTPTPTPSHQQVAVTTAVAAGGGRLYTRERGRRKSYTTGEKLAMIEAVEGGQRKSVVADRFGVAPSTLACILAQRHKIRSEKDNLARRRVRHTRYQELREDMVGGGVISSSAASISSVSPPHQPFTHFLAPLTSPTPPTFLDTQPEEIIAVPDLVDRVPGTSSSKDHDDDPDHDQDSQVIMDHQDPHHIDLDERKGTNKSFHPPQTHHSDVGEEDPLADHQRQSPSPTHSNTGNIAGLVGPYLLKKETHCTTVLDQLMRDDTFTDVTLTAQGQSLRAHRIVLCLASSYFRQVLSRDMGVQSVIVLRDIKFAELRNIIHFIYTGEATVDASELESFMKTAELLEISSLCEGQKCITGRSHSSSSSNNTTNTNNHSSSFSVGDFERLVGTKRPRKDTSPTSARIKTRRHSGDGGSSRCSSTEPPATPTLTLVKEEPDCDITETFTPIITSVASGSSKIVASDAKFLESDNQTTTGGGGGGEEQTSEATGSSKRSRRDSTGSVGGFAAIAGVQQKMVCEEEGDDDPGEVFSPAPVTSPSSSQAGPPHTTHTPDLTPADTTAVPGRCPYCPHISHKFEGLTMMRHLLVSHPCKPAFPCSTCWRVFVKRVAFKAHQQICQQQQLGS